MPFPVALAGAAAAAAIAIPLLRRALVAIGFGLVAYVGVGLLWDAIQDNITANLGQASSSILAILGLARVDDAIQVVFSAITAKLALRGLNAAGALISPRWKWVN